MRAGPQMSRSLCHGEAAPCPKPLRKYVLAVAVLGSAMGFIDGTIITVAVQPIRSALGASFAQMQWVVNGYVLALAAFLLIGGAAGDRYGKRRLFGLGLVVFTLASVLCGLAPDPLTLIAARVVQGLGAAMLVPGSLALIAVNFPASERGKAVGIWAAASGVTTAIGPLLGGALIDVGSWRAIFFINLPLGVLTLALLYAKVPADKPTGGGRFDALGAILAFLGVGALALGFTLAETRSLAAPAVLGALAAGVGLLAGFLAWQARAKSPMMPLELFSSRTFALANAETLLVYFALTGTVFFLPIVMMEAHGWRAVEAGAVFVPFTVAMALVSPIAGRLADRIGNRTLLVSGPLIVAGAFFALGPAARIDDFLTGVAPVMVAFGVGMGLAIPPLSTAVLNDVSDARTGIASGINNAISRVAGLFAVAILGLVASTLFRAAVGVPDAGFAATVPDVAEATRQDAILSTFALLCQVNAALCAAGAALALALPRLRDAPASS